MKSIQITDFWLCTHVCTSNCPSGATWMAACQRKHTCASLNQFTLGLLPGDCDLPRDLSSHAGSKHSPFVTASTPGGLQTWQTCYNKSENIMYLRT